MMSTTTWIHYPTSSPQCKIFQYTFLGQWHFTISLPCARFDSWQLDHRKLGRKEGPSEIRLFSCRKQIWKSNADKFRRKSRHGTFLSRIYFRPHGFESMHLWDQKIHHRNPFKNVSPILALINGFIYEVLVSVQINFVFDDDSLQTSRWYSQENRIILST